MDEGFTGLIRIVYSTGGAVFPVVNTLLCSPVVSVHDFARCYLLNMEIVVNVVAYIQLI